MDQEAEAKSGKISGESPFLTILEWSETWPEWQRDALRRIIQSGPFGDDVPKELAAICRAKHALLPSDSIPHAAVPFAAEHVPGGAESTESVSLLKLSALQNVGRLPSDQEIVFGPSPGLTVIYGENGAGKSGYARVIKKACRARGTVQTIKPNAFETGTAGPAEATISCRSGSEDRVVSWVDGGPSDARLGNILVFDSFSAQVHVGEDGPACFKPRGLDVLPELARACDAVKAELQRDSENIRAEITRISQGWQHNEDTVVGRFIKALGPTTNPETKELTAVFMDADERRLAEIIATLSTDPKIKAADTTAAAKRIRAFAESATSRATSVDDSAMQYLGEAIRDLETTVKAAKAATGPELEDSDLPGSCNDVWRKLWDAAKAYSVAHAYPDKPFPVTDADAKCVLCQQPLQADAIDRYARFNKFVANETRKQADAAKAKVAEMKPGVDSLRVIGTEATSIKADLDREATGTFAAVEAFARTVDARIAHAEKCIKDGAWADAPALSASPYEELVTLADTLDNRAQEELAAADPEKAKALTIERDELTDKKWLAGKKNEVKDQIGRYKHRERLKNCQDDCTTGTITRKSGELHETYVTAAFCQAFGDELKALGLKSLPVKLEASKGAKGERRFGLKLEGSGQKVYEIASEGEHRCIALAAFMAELSLASNKSAVVFDDPVSSLDHCWREKVASRLVDLASERQVVVFSHDLYFACILAQKAKEKSVVHCGLTIFRNSKSPGFISGNSDWNAMPTKGRIAYLEERHRKASTLETSPDVEDYRKEVFLFYDRLRSAWEGYVEEWLLNGVVLRYGKAVQTSRLKKVASDLKASDFDVVESAMTRCSEQTPAHDMAPETQRATPTPEDLLRDLTLLKETFLAMKKRRS